MLVLHSHMPYVLSHGKSPHGTDWIHESAAECYLPILDALDRMRNNGVKPRWTVNVSPILAEQLDDDTFKQGFQDYCQEKIEAAILDQEEFTKNEDLWMTGLAAMWQRVYTRALVQFKHQWHKDICGAFAAFQEDGLIELVTCGATHGYLPLLSTEESVAAQVSLAVETHTARFGKKPRGIWLPECAYRPAYEWKAPAGDSAPFPRRSTDQFLADQGLEFFFVDSHMVRGGEPLGTYWQQFPQLAELFERSKHLFIKPEHERSEYEHYQLPTGVKVFARDPESTVKVWSGDVGYPGNEHYLEFHKQLYPGRLRYWRISREKADLGQKQPYDPWQALDLTSAHAKDFVSLVKSTLQAHADRTGHQGTLVAMYDTELFGHWWWEGPEFLYELGTAMAADPDILSASGSDVIDADPDPPGIHLPEGSWGEGGYHSVWLNEENHWTWELLYPRERRLAHIAAQDLTTQANEIAVQAARELLLAQASDWQFLISTQSAKDYAEARFQDHIERFDRLADMLEPPGHPESLNKADTAFLQECRTKDSCFPSLTLGHWKSIDPVSTTKT